MSLNIQCLPCFLHSVLEVCPSSKKNAVEGEGLLNTKGKSVPRVLQVE